MPSSSQPGTFRRLTLAPVASRDLSNLTPSPFDSVALRSSTSSSVTEVRVSASTRCSSYHSGGRNGTPDRSSARRYSFEHGGRLYGNSGSRPTSKIDPSAPDSRSQREQFPEASPPPISR